MKAAVLEAHREPLVVQNVPDPEFNRQGAVIHVGVNGVCRSDCHVWMGDSDGFGVKRSLPHVLGHEMSGIVQEVGADVTGCRTGGRVVGLSAVQPARYTRMLQLVDQQVLRPGEWVTKTIGIGGVREVLAGMTNDRSFAVTVVTKW